MASFNKRNKFLRENVLLGISRGGGLGPTNSTPRWTWTRERSDHEVLMSF